MENRRVRQTSGGQYLEQLRLRSGLSQLQVAQKSGVANYAKYESGERPEPKRETVVQMLDALTNRFSERKEALERFTYIAHTPAPTDEEIAWACEVCQPVMDSVPFPSYLLDMRAYILAWNLYCPPLLSTTDRHMTFLLKPNRLTLFQAFFHPGLAIADKMGNREQFLDHVVRVLRQDYKPYMNEPWCIEILGYTFRRYPEFAQVWSTVSELPPNEIPARPLTHLRIQTNKGLTAFRVAIERMTRDERFKVVYLLPADIATVEICEVWKKEAAQAAQI